MSNYNRKTDQKNRGNNDPVEDNKLTIASQFLEVQYKNAETETQRVKLESERLDKDFKLANKSMDIQRELLLKKPGENRKNLIVIFVCILIIVLVIAGFIGWLLYSGNDEFAGKIISAVSYVIVSGLSYYFGKSKSKKNSGMDDVSDTEIID